VTTGRGWLRGGLVLLTCVQTGIGTWMLLAPRSFYDTVPTVAMYPPYNQHLLNDLGALNLALALVLAVAAVSLSRPLTTTGLTAYLAYAVPHLTFHATHLHGLRRADAIVLTSALALLVLAAAALVILVNSGAASAPTRACTKPE
jgi:hypothetical protein